MQALPGLPLPNDIVDRILSFCPDVPTLSSAILTSKSFYHIFQARPQSILRAVAYNEVGPALPQALRFIRTKLAKEDAEEDESDAEPWTIPDETNNILLISAAELRSLSSCVSITQALEDLFSQL